MNVNNLGLNDLGGEVVDLWWTDTDGVTRMGDPEDPGKEPDQWNEYPDSDNELLREEKKKKKKKHTVDEYYDSEDEGARRRQEYNAWLDKEYAADAKKRKRKRKQ